MRIFSRLDIDGPLQIRLPSSCFFRDSVGIDARALLEPQNGRSRSSPLTSCVPLCCSLLQSVAVCFKYVSANSPSPPIPGNFWGSGDIFETRMHFCVSCVHKGKFSLSRCSFLLEIQVADSAMAFILLLCVENCGKIMTSFEWGSKFNSNKIQGTQHAEEKNHGTLCSLRLFSRLWKTKALFVAGTRKLCCVCNKKVDALAIQASDVRKVWCFYFFQIFVNCQFVSHASEATKKQPGHLISHQSFSCDR